MRSFKPLNSVGPLLGFVFVVVTLPNQFSAFQYENTVEINEIVIKDVVAYGSKDQNGNCVFEPFSLENTPPTETTEETDSSWAGFAIDESCRMKLEARWVGQVEDGPAEFLEPLLQILSKAEILSVDVVNSGENPESENPELPSKTSQQWVYSYGGGGQLLDKLTELTTAINYSYNGTQVWITSRGGTCKGSILPTWSWVIDACYQIAYGGGPASSVFYDAGGNYHCTPVTQIPCNWSQPDGYWHSLYSYLDAFANGTSQCTFGSSGQVVLGPKSKILQGCQ